MQPHSAEARDKVNEAMQRQGLDIDINQLKPENLDELIDQISDLTVDVDHEHAKVASTANSGGQRGANAYRLGLHKGGARSPTGFTTHHAPQRPSSRPQQRKPRREGTRVTGR